MAYSRVYLFLSRRWWLTFLLMGVSFVLFGLVSLNLLHTLGANLEFLSSYGVDAVREGGLWQLVGLIASGYAAAACYVVFKLCEKVLVERLATGRAEGMNS
jgi:hypothetical protein